MSLWGLHCRLGYRLQVTFPIDMRGEQDTKRALLTVGGGTKEDEQKLLRGCAGET